MVLTDAVQIEFDDISEGDTIRVVRTNDNVDLVLQGVAEWQDDDGDWLTGDELLTFKDSPQYDEEYYLVKSGSLSSEPGTLVTYDNARGLPVFALKTHNEDDWFVTYPDGSSGIFDSLRIATKQWSPLT